MQFKGASLKVSQRNSGVGGGHANITDHHQENDYKLPTIKDIHNGLSSGLAIK